MSADTVLCDHCGTPMAAAAAIVVAASEGEGRRFCCPGCAAAAELIAAGGFERFYEKREGWSPKPDALRSVAGFDSSWFHDSHVTVRPDGQRETRLFISGVRCTACTWLLERVLGDAPGVAEVHVSYGTDEARIVWNPDATPLSAVAQRIVRLGYEPLSVTARPERNSELIARLGIAAFCAINVMMLQITLYAGWFGGMAERHAALFRWMALVFATPAALYSSAPFFERAWRGLKAGVLHMDVPVSLAVAIMYAHGLISVLMSRDGYLDSMTMLIALLLAGRLIEERGRLRARDAAGALLSSAPETARRQVGQRIEEVPVQDLAPGDQILIGVGAVVPVDGRVASGTCEVDRSVITGESTPERLGEGAAVASGSLLLSGALVVTVEATHAESTLYRMAKLVSEARGQKAPATRLADRIAPWFVAVTLTVAALTFLIWSLMAGPTAALPVTIAVLVVACPCALALATPAALSAGLGAAARRGVFIRQPSTLEGAADIDILLIDKTGTLTEGKLRVEEADDELLRLASGLERFSSHPIARAILREARERLIPLPAAEDVEETPGQGIRGRIEGQVVEVSAGGPGLVMLTVDGVRAGAITLRDQLRDDSAAALEALDIPVVMITGDRDQVAQQIVARAGVTEHLAEATPEDKVAAVKAHQAAGRRVLFAGDGVNDAPAVAAADIGVAMGDGAAAALLAAHAVVVSPSVAPVVWLLRISRETHRVLLVNTRFSLLYNTLAVTAAALGWINPLIAAVLMPFSSLFVVLNATAMERRLRRGYRTGPVAHLGGPGSGVRHPVPTGSALGTV